MNHEDSATRSLAGVSYNNRLELYLYLDGLGFVLETVESRNDVNEFLLTMLIGELVHAATCDGEEVFGSREVNLFALYKAIDGVLTSSIHFVLGFRSRPEEVISVGHPEGFNL